MKQQVSFTKTDKWYTDTFCGSLCNSFNSLFSAFEKGSFMAILRSETTSLNTKKVLQ